MVQPWMFTMTIKQVTSIWSIFIQLSSFTFILIIVQRDATQSSLFIILQVVWLTREICTALCFMMYLVGTIINTDRRCTVP